MPVHMLILYLHLCLLMLFTGCNAKPENIQDEGTTPAKVIAMKPENGKLRIRPPSKAGSWYAGKPKSLKAQLQDFFESATAPKSEHPVRALICPHAGYDYSGKTAAVAYKSLENRNLKRVIVLAPSHYARFEGGSIMDVTHYATPLGEIPLDRAACDELLSHEYFTTVEKAHPQEHSLELQLPFLQYVLKEGFQIIPIVLSDIPASWLEPMAKCLLPYWDENTLIVASSDFTHYGARFGYVPFRENIAENLEKLDMGAVQKIVDVDCQGFNRYIEKTEATICGKMPISLLLSMAALRGAKGHLFEYTNSGRMLGDFSNSVSYAAIGFTCEDSAMDQSSGNASAALTETEEQTLLQLVRHTLKTFLATGKKPKALSDFEITEALQKELGVFVTLKKNKRLRGCIGYLRGTMPLYRAVIDNTISAASKDPRFPPVALSEEPQLHIEVSVLSPVMRVTDLNEIMVGRDGLIVSRGFNKGTLLPQVPVEQGWDRTTFLEQTCRKAGLPTDAYKDPDTVIERYAAQVFGESE